MKRLPILVLVLVAGMFLAFKSINAGAKTPVNPPSKYEQIMKLVGEMLSQGHYSPQDINDAFSKKVFAKYLKELDIEKNFFFESGY
jgi:carboxyl-terminal processing protease